MIWQLCYLGRLPVSDKYYFDDTAAQVAINFFGLLRHTKGEWAGQPFILDDWQIEDIIKPVFGWKRHSDGTRRYRTVYIEVPRKSGKSTIAAGMAALLLLADGEAGAEVYSAAADRDQARIVFEQAKQMIEGSPRLAKITDVFKNTIMAPKKSVYRVLSADAPTKHGLNAHGVIFDELHAQPNRDLWDVLTTSVGARRQPLIVAITTAGYNRQSICWEMHEYARQIKEGIIDDDSFLPIIYAADENDDWLDEKTWEKANPGIDKTIKREYLQNEARKAENVPAYQNTFRRLHLNQWVQQETRWLDMTAWDNCDEAIDPNLLQGALCYGGLDLASTSDIASLVLCFPNEPGDKERYALMPFFWIPEDNMIERARKDRVPYDAWVRDGLVMATPGNVIDYGYIIRHIEELGEKYRISEIAFDRWGATQISQTLEGAGFTMVGFGQGFASMSPPTKELMRIVLDGKLVHGGNPVLRWMADNLVVSSDAAGNMKPNKAKSREKIDGIVASVMALDRAIRHEGKPMSVYESRGLEVI
jgi:phage terminase large subunit-like protein